MFELTDTIYGNEIRSWLIALAVAAGVLVALRLVERLLVVRIQRMAKHTETMIDDIIIGSLRKTKLLYLLVVALFAGSLSLRLEPDVRSLVWSGLMVATLIQIGIWVSTGLQIWLEHYRKIEEDGAN
ncbi:MAG: hypothetical protein HKN10_14510, partial [Myxococcales bacterium]|nr:hypothetical protein [Myxococcales bacterium]